MTDAPNRPRADRLKTLIDTAITFRSQDENKPDVNVVATCLDISATGMVFTCDKLPRIGTPLTVSLGLPAGTRFRAHAKVVRCEPLPKKGRFKIAVHFADLLDDNRLKLEEFLDGEKRRHW